MNLTNTLSKDFFLPGKLKPFGLPLAILMLIVSYFIIKVLFKTRKRSAESIYKLIEDLEKKYIYWVNYYRYFKKWF